MSAEIKQVAYTDDAQELSVWLEDQSTRPPVVFPYWPSDFPKTAAVGVSLQGELCVALSRLAMLQARHPERIWFCVDSAEVVRATDAEASWFQH